jgi:anhydro-N-acetylmuramic acid kinase
MSGTSLDGVDLAYCRFTYKEDNWIYKILNTETVPYSDIWEQRLKSLTDVSAAEIIATDRAYGHYLGELVKNFIAEKNLSVDFISSHGHTVFHQPQLHITFQVGSGAYLAAAAHLPTVCDFRTLDIALGGQGAPLVPIGDRLLFADFDFCLNLGGISNISQEGEAGQRVAFDISCCNMLLNPLAQQLGQPYDRNGDLARSGIFNQANCIPLVTTSGPRSRNP